MNEETYFKVPESGNVVKIWDDLYLVTQDINGVFIKIVRLSDGCCAEIRTDKRVDVVVGDLVVKPHSS